MNQAGGCSSSRSIGFCSSKRSSVRITSSLGLSSRHGRVVTCVRSSGPGHSSGQGHSCGQGHSSRRSKLFSRHHTESKHFRETSGTVLVVLVVSCSEHNLWRRRSPSSHEYIHQRGGRALLPRLLLQRCPRRISCSRANSVVLLVYGMVVCSMWSCTVCITCGRVMCVRSVSMFVVVVCKNMGLQVFLA